ncbi:MAG: sulfate adenylyltransferase subunit CysD [Mariprofundales bacterium]|nr:sulfate adenylyltransferase subunit CysD [Mariprofundales bacterium]
MNQQKLTQLKMLESESIHIIREVVAEFRNPVMLYSIGKDSSVMLHLARKAFYPAPLPFSLLHVDTGYKFPEMYQFRDWFVKSVGAELIVRKNEDAIAKGMNPKAFGVARCCGALKTGGLLAALEEGNYDAAFGGARRDEERSRAKERVFSIRDEFGQWDPKNQRPELWDIYNGSIHDGESVRVFPLSNWTEMDIWLYLRQEEIPIVPLYYAKERLMIERGSMLIPFYEGMEDQLLPGEEPTMVMCRFRSLGCMPCSGAVRSNATTIDEVVIEAAAAKRSERETRIIDHGSNSMEDKKKEGYF